MFYQEPHEWSPDHFLEFRTHSILSGKLIFLPLDTCSFLLINLLFSKPLFITAGKLSSFLEQLCLGPQKTQHYGSSPKSSLLFPRLSVDGLCLSQVLYSNRQPVCRRCYPKPGMLCQNSLLHSLQFVKWIKGDSRSFPFVPQVYLCK